MTIDVYYLPTSPPSRTVLLAAATLGLEVNKIHVNTQAGDLTKPEFLKLNPQHTVPTMVDDGFALWESRAIIRYLANKYGKHTSLYPEDPKTRAIIDQRLDFDLGTLCARFLNYFLGTPGDETLRKKLEEALEFLDTFLKENKYAAGSELTLADLSLVSGISVFDVIGFDLNPYPNIVKWYELLKNTIPKYEEVTREGIEAQKAIMAKMQNKSSDE